MVASIYIHFQLVFKAHLILKQLKTVSQHIDSVHHEVIFTIQEGLDALEDVIFSLETYDVTTVRAATPMYLMARVIKSMGIKMVLSGEGADEIFGGYLYFHKAPSAIEFPNETVRKLKNCIFMTVSELIRQWQHGVLRLGYHFWIRNLLILQWE